MESSLNKTEEKIDKIAKKIKLESSVLLKEVEKDFGFSDVENMTKDVFVSKLKEKNIWFNEVHLHDSKLDSELSFNWLLIETEKYLFNFIFNEFQLVKKK